MSGRLAALIDRGRAPSVLEGVDRDRAVDGLRAIDSLTAWCEAQRARWTQVLTVECDAPKVVVAEVSRCSPKEADRLVDRAATLDAVPGFAEALSEGRVAAGHVDALTRGLASLDNDDQRTRLTEVAGQLEHAAAVMTPDDFAKRVRREVQRIQAADGSDDPHARLARHRRAARLRTWTDRESGMWCLAGRFDPLTGFAIHNQIQDTVNRGVVVIDTAQLQPVGTPAVDWGIPIEVPLSVLAELAERPVDDDVVLVCNGLVIHAPGALNLGRSTRTANRAQRRALHGLYRTCAVPGCAVDYRWCKLHHIIWWRNGGLTDLDNLLPLCERHHHAVHDRGWTITMDPRRGLTINLPDGTTLSTGPPTRGGP